VWPTSPYCVHIIATSPVHLPRQPHSCPQLHCIALHSIAPLTEHCIALHSTATSLYFTALHCTAFHSTPPEALPAVDKMGDHGNGHGKDSDKTNADADGMTVATFAKLQPREYQRKFMEHGVRPDGRALNTVRPTVMAPAAISSCPGSSLVKIGNTAVVCAVKLEVGKPFDTKPQDGRIAVDVQLPPLCSPKFKVGRATEQAIGLSQWLTYAVVNSHSLLLSDLSIQSGSSCWVLYADLLCLNYDGNVYDACLLALMQSLRRVQLPDTEIIEEAAGSVTSSAAAGEVCISETSFRPLPIHSTIMATTFGCMDHHLLADPTAAEEELLSGQVTIVVNDKTELCQVHKPGGTPLSDHQLKQCIAIAKSRVALVLPLFK